MPRRLNVVDSRYLTLRKSRPKSQVLDGPVIAVACSADGSFSAAATEQTLYGFHSGKLIWKYRTKGNKGVLVALRGSLVLAITYEGLLALSMQSEANGQPSLLWEYPTEADVFDATLSAEGDQVLAAVGHKLMLFDKGGRRLWTKDSKEFVAGVAISPDKSLYLAGMERSLRCYNLNGDLEWEHRTGGLVQGVDMTPSGEFIVAASGRRPTKQIFFLNRLGQKLWTADAGTYKGLRVADDSSLIVASSSNQVFGFSSEGERVWTFTSQDFINWIESVGSGRLTLVASGSEIKNISRLYCVDERGQVLWSYRPAGLARDVALSEDGGKVLLAAGRRIYWLDNTPYLQVETERLQERCQVYLSELTEVQIDLEGPQGLLEQSRQRLEAGELKPAYRAAQEAYKRLSQLHHRYLDYRDDLPKFTERIHVDAALPERLIPTIYPLYSKHSDLVEETLLTSTRGLIKEKLQRFKQVTATVRQRPEQEQVSNSPAAKEVTERLTLAQAGIKELRSLMTNLRELQKEWDENLRSLEEHSRLLVMDWLTLGTISSDIPAIVTRADEKAHSLREEVLALNRRVGTITTMVEAQSPLHDQGLTGKLAFRPYDEGVQLVVSLHNQTDHPLQAITTFLYLAGEGLRLREPASGTLTFGDLGPGQRLEAVADCQAVKPVPTTFHSTVSYIDHRGNQYHARLEALETSLLSTFIIPWVLEEQESDEWRRSHEEKADDETLYFSNLELEEAGRAVQSRFANLYLIGGEPRPSSSKDALAFNYSCRQIMKRVSYLVTITLRKTSGGLEVNLVCFASTKNDSKTMLSTVSKRLSQALLKMGGRLA